MKNLKNTILGASSLESAQNIESTQWTKYGARHANGWGAEDWNALIDVLSGKRVDKVGINNELNGADRIVNGIKIQSKYCRTAFDSVDHAFKDGVYRYSGQKLEVPKGQGEEAVRLFQERIIHGKVPGVKDPAMAKEIIMEGHCTYDQAVRVTKAGNIESLKFDAMNQMVTCSMVAGLTFVITFAGCMANGMTPWQSLMNALKHSSITGVFYLTANIATEQFLRTQPGRNVAAAATKGARKLVETCCKSKVGTKAIRQMVIKQTGEGAAEMSAKVAATKLLRTNMITAAAMTVAVTIPDIVKSVRGKQSWKQSGMNAVTNTAGTCGGWGGAVAGAAIGSMICPGIGTTIGGFIGGMAGGIAAQSGMQKLFSCTAKAKMA